MDSFMIYYYIREIQPFQVIICSCEEGSNFLVSSKIVIVLAKSLKNPSQSAIYPDNYFTSIELVEYLRDKRGCHYVGTASTP